MDNELAKQLNKLEQLIKQKYGMPDLCLVEREIKRQRDLYGDQSELSPLAYLAIITEELGELAEAITETYLDGAHPERGGHDNMFREAIHVAATAISALGSIRSSARLAGKEISEDV